MLCTVMDEFLAARHHAGLFTAPGPSCGPWMLLCVFSESFRVQL
jgi:hypothetical protein